MNRRSITSISSGLVALSILVACGGNGASPTSVPTAVSVPTEAATISAPTVAATDAMTSTDTMSGTTGSTGTMTSTDTMTGTTMPGSTGAMTSTDMMTGTAMPGSTGAMTGTDMMTGTAMPGSTGAMTGTDMMTGTAMPGSTGAMTSTDMMSSTDSMSGTSMMDMTIGEVAMGNGQFKTLVTALKAAGMADALNGDGPFTVFAPTDAAFAKLDASTLTTLLKPENKAQLVKILNYHVIPKKVLAADVMGMTSAKTLGGEELKITSSGGNVMINNAKIIASDIQTKNGVIHVIDTVLMPTTK